MERAIYMTSGADADPPLCRADYARGRIDEAELCTFDDAGFEDGLFRYTVLLLPIHVDQILLTARRAVLERWLDAGGTMVVNGHVAYPFLDGLARFVPLVRPRLADYEIAPLTPHPIFAGIDFHDLTFRHGVSGFYGRGHNPPPAGAVPLNGVGPERVPVDWLWERPGGGRVLMHSGNNIWMYIGEESTAERLPRQLVAWLFGEGSEHA